MGETKKPTRKSNGLLILFAVLIAWTLLIAFGSFQTQASTDFRRPLIVVICMSVFLGSWGLALWARRKRQED
jgi:hypothetical protein